jgi:hypothetical protein
MPNETLIQLFDFLKSNRVYNKEVQQSFYKSVILPYDSPNDKIISLLHHVANTQSQPNIDKLYIFYKLIQDNYESLSTFKGFLVLLNSGEVSVAPNYVNAFDGLNKSSGWGKKTAALLVKSIYHLHNGDYGEELKIWTDTPSKISGGEKFYLPVDSVIQFIFKEAKINCRYDFDGINRYLHELDNYPGDLMEVWDDLWFWGFITQKIVDKVRTIGWNESKYWALLHTKKSKTVVDDIREKADIFMDILVRF